MDSIVFSVMLILDTGSGLTEFTILVTQQFSHLIISEFLLI